MRTKLKTLILEKCGKQSVLAYKMGLSEGMISKIVHGEKPIPAEKLPLFAEILGVTCKELKEMCTKQYELNRLEDYLRKHGYIYKREDKELGPYMNRHQIVVYDSNHRYLWDAICHFGSYGYEDGLLEVMGDVARRDSDRVEGWLTADEIIRRLEGKA